MKEVILDFNKPINFTLSNASRYNLKTIYANIEKFHRFTQNEMKLESFEKVFNTAVFQVALLNDDTCDADTLLTTYNLIATKGVVEGVVSTPLTKRQLTHYLKLKGYTQKYTSTMAGGEKVNITKFVPTTISRGEY